MFGSESGLVSYLGWSFVPDLIAGILQSVFYTFFRPGSAPSKDSRRYSLHRVYAKIAATVFFLLLSLYEVDSNIREDGDFYSLLGLSPFATERQVNQHFRRLALEYHPDKASGRADIYPGESEQVYNMLQIAREALTDPIHRFAYDRFGPSIFQCRHCKTRSDFIWAGVSNLLPSHIGSILFMVFSNVFGFLTSGKYWRYYTLAVLITLEAYMLTRPGFPLLDQLNRLFLLLPFAPHPPLLPFQLLKLAREFSVIIFIGINRLQPLLAHVDLGGFSSVGGGRGYVKPELSNGVRDRTIAVALGIGELEERLRKSPMALKRASQSEDSNDLVRQTPSTSS